MVAITSQRVPDHTKEEINERIANETERRIAYFADHRDEIPRRLEELDREWDIERVLETGSATLSLTGLAMSVLHSRKWLILPIAVQGFFMQHALQGWCPPLPVFRRLGIRTQDEIAQERYALKALRGDFANADSAGTALAAVEQ